MAELDNPRLIFRNNLREDKLMMPRLFEQLSLFFCSEVKSVFCWKEKYNCFCKNQKKQLNVFVDFVTHTV